MTAKVTRIVNEKGNTRFFTAKSGTKYEVRDLNFYQAMKADGLATDDSGMPVIMEIPYVRALATIVSVNDVPFGPIRTKIDVQKWAEKLSGADSDEILTFLRATEIEPNDLKNE